MMLSAAVALRIPPPQPHSTFALVGEGHVLFDVVGDRAHADLVAQIADGDIRHALRAQLVPERLALGLHLGHILPTALW